MAKKKVAVKKEPTPKSEVVVAPPVVAKVEEAPVVETTVSEELSDMALLQAMKARYSEEEKGHNNRVNCQKIRTLLSATIHHVGGIKPKK